MSLARFTLCRQFLMSRKGMQTLSTVRTTVSKQSRLEMDVPKLLTRNAGCTDTCYYSTSAKPHMTPSLHKWKKKKRKSKAQQKKALDKLQEDLVKLLTKRAVELVKNKSILGSQREIVTTHNFTTFHDRGNADFQGWIPLDPVERSQLISELGSLSRKIQNSQGKSRNDVLKSVPALGMESSVDFEQMANIDQDAHKSFIKPFTYSDLFHEQEMYSKGASPQKETPNFRRDLEKFKSELEKTKRLFAANSTLVVHNWDVDTQDGPAATQTINSTEHAHIQKAKAQVHDSSHQQESLRHLAHKQELNDSGVNYDNHANLQKDGLPSEWDQEDIDAIKWADSARDRRLSDFHESQLEFKPNFGESVLPQDFVDEFNAEILTVAHQFGDTYSAPDLSQESRGEPICQQPSTAALKHSRKSQASVKSKSPDASVQKLKKGQKDKKHHKHSKERHLHLNVNRELQDLNNKSFVEACCFTGEERLAIRNLQYQTAKHRISCIEEFDKLVRTLAKKRDLDTIKTLFSMMRQQEITPTLQTYAGCLECLGRMADADISTCEKIIADIARSGLNLQEIANTCSFEGDEWDYVLKAVRSVDPDFTPDAASLISPYDNILLTSLNSPDEQAVEKNQYALDLNKQTLLNRAAAQLEMEKQGKVVVESISTTAHRSSDKSLKELRERVLTEWRRVLLQSFEQKLAVCANKAKDNVSMTLSPYLKLFPPEKYVDIIFQCLQELFTSSEGYSASQPMIRLFLGRAVNRKYDTEVKIAAGMDKKILQLYDKYVDDYLSEDKPLDNHRYMWLRAMSQYYDTVNMDMSMKKWLGHIHREIGNFLLEMILYDLKIDANLFRARAAQRPVPAFCTIFRPDVTFHSVCEIKLHPVVSKLFKGDNAESFTFDPSTVPMIVPPVPWISKSMGGLLLGTNSLVRMGADMHHVDSLKHVKESRYAPVLDSLNTLSACAWKINKPILDLQIQIFNNNGDARLKVAPPAQDLPPLPVITSDMTGKDKAMLFRERLQLQQQKQDMHGLWCTDLYRLSIANKFRDQVFWFPHSMDFRGRTYPLPPHFNHLGSDNVRGMLLFAKGKPLGEKGYDWLKIHLINLTGLRKRSSNKERLEYAESLMAEILDSADNPMTGNKWWHSSDEPWQTLACCKEIANIERFEGNKEDYICSFPVHQDGSCNGLQHYAALGRDQAGAESVNLHPFDTPKDVYSDVVELVERARQKDAEEGDEIAKVLEGFIKRKVIKQTIMTTVYGVTKYGAKLQIHRQLKDIPDFPHEHAWRASLYLTNTTFVCLREMFTATKDIQDWLTESARQISAFAPVDWVTPLGFPVLQLYFKRLNKKESKYDRFKPNTMKQTNAFPPNYIHSLDSTHMMLTSLYCMHAGITFVSVHDCYWTHACDVPIMNKICREQFVNLHKQPLLEDLSDHLLALVDRATQDPNLQDLVKKVDVQALQNLLGDVPKRGAFDLDNVLKAEYFFS